MQSLAAVLVELHSPLEFIDLEFPALKRGQVLVKMAFSGICRTQINEIKGFKGKDNYLPHTLGHEGSAVVMEVGEGVSKVKPGDHVVTTWIKGSGLEERSVVYKHKNMQVNSGAISTFMDYSIISENRLVPIPKDFSLREAALFGCAIPTGAGIIFNDLRLQKGSTVAIFGVGGIGLSAVLAAYAKEAEIIIAVDMEDDKLLIAKKMGATHTINAGKENVLDEISKITKNVGLDYAVESAGYKNVMEVAFKAVKDKGGVCVLAGNVPFGTCIECDPFDFIKGKKMIGSWGGGVDPDRDIPLFLDLFMKRKMNLSEMITHDVPLEELNEAIQMVEDRKAARALIHFG
ncbi:MAG: zinc-binding dehydrogenase [Chlamydiales bacterium]|nr:zinc-binding dehydrogenase [Chlamydiales bacterium]